MFLAIIDGQYMDSNSIETTVTFWKKFLLKNFEKEGDSNFLNLFITLLKEQYKREEEAAEKFNKEKTNPEKVNDKHHKNLTSSRNQNKTSLKK